MDFDDSGIGGNCGGELSFGKQTLNLALDKCRIAQIWGFLKDSIEDRQAVL